MDNFRVIPSEISLGCAIHIPGTVTPERHPFSPTESRFVSCPPTPRYWFFVPFPLTYVTMILLYSPSPLRPIWVDCLKNDVRPVPLAVVDPPPFPTPWASL